MDFSLDNGLTEESIPWESLFRTSEDDEDVGGVQISDYFDADFFVGDQMQTQVKILPLEFSFGCCDYFSYKFSFKMVSTESQGHFPFPCYLKFKNNFLAIIFVNRKFNEEQFKI